jgi:DNA-binding NarL/FixJ family response regulator
MANPVSLSPREMQIARCVSRGMQNKEIADLLGVSICTVKYHLAESLSKIAILSRIARPSRIDLAVYYVRAELAVTKKSTRRIPIAA